MNNIWFYSGFRFSDHIWCLSAGPCIVLSVMYSEMTTLRSSSMSGGQEVYRCMLRTGFCIRQKLMFQSFYLKTESVKSNDKLPFDLKDDFVFAILDSALGLVHLGCQLHLEELSEDVR